MVVFLINMYLQCGFCNTFWKVYSTAPIAADDKVWKYHLKNKVGIKLRPHSANTHDSCSLTELENWVNMKYFWLIGVFFSPGEVEKTVYGDQVKAAVQTPWFSTLKIVCKCQNI